MGRRAVPTVDPELDLSDYLKTLEQLPQPWDSNALFGTDAPLEVEVGSGKGLFLQNVASSTPERNFLGIEVARKYARFTASRLARLSLSNAVMVSCDGHRLFKERIPDQSLAGVHVYFPDPWWKRRHRRRRVLTPDFLAEIARTLLPGGTFHFWTDVEEYFLTTLRLIDAVASLEGPEAVAERVAEHDLDYLTHFERRKRQESLPIFRAIFTKIAD